MVNWAQTVHRTISQQTFDEAVHDNVHDLDMALDEAIQEARLQFQAQGVDLTGIRDTIPGEQKSALHDLNSAIAARAEDDIVHAIDAIEEGEACALAEQGLIGALLFVCREFRHRKRLVQSALSVLTISTKSVPPASIPEPGLVALLQCLQHHAEDAHIQSYGLKVVQQAIDRFEPHKIAIHSNGFNDYIAAILKAHRDESVTFVKACYVVRRYLSDDDRRPGVHPHTFARARELSVANQSEIISIMVSALKRYAEDPAYVAAICLTLRCMAVTDTICNELSQTVLDQLIAVLKLHLPRGDVVEKVFSLLKILSRSDQVKRLLYYHEALHLAMTAIEHHTDQDKVVAQVLGTLSAITLRQPENCLSLADHGAIPLLVSSMSNHPDHIAIQRAAISTLRNMVSSSRTKELSSLILQEDAELLICKAHDTHEQCKDVAYAALRDLGRPYKATWSQFES